MKCSICGMDIDIHPGSLWSDGHNAEPVNDGRCCTVCNNRVVIPRRLAYLKMGVTRVESKKSKTPTTA